MKKKKKLRLTNKIVLSYRELKENGKESKPLIGKVVTLQNNNNNVKTNNMVTMMSIFKKDYDCNTIDTSIYNYRNLERERLE